MGPPPTQAIVDNSPTERTMRMVSSGAASSSKQLRGEEDLDNITPKGKLADVGNGSNEGIVVSMMIIKHPVKRILIDSGSSADIITYDAFVQMNLPLDSLRLVTTPLIGFTGNSVGVEGEITLPMTAETLSCQSMVMMIFLIVQVPLAYNTILGYPGLNLLDAVISTRRLLVQFPLDTGIGEMRGGLDSVLPCYHTIPGSQEVAPPWEASDSKEDAKGGEPTEQLLSFPLGDDPMRKVYVGRLLPSEDQSHLLAFLWANSDVFAWSAFDMIGIPPEVITHKLNINPEHRPIRQKKRSFAPDRQKAIDEEVSKLLAVGHIREAHYLNWLANVIMVCKANESWRICIDFTDLNKECPKDSFTLP